MQPSEIFSNFLIFMVIVNAHVTIWLSWALIRGMDQLPTVIVGFLPLFILTLGCGSCFVVGLVGNVHERSGKVIRMIKFNSQTVSKKQRKEAEAQSLISFKCWTLFDVNKMTGLIFLFYMLERVATFVLIF